MSHKEARTKALAALRIFAEKKERKDFVLINWKALYDYLSVQGFCYLTETGDLSGLYFVLSAYETMEKYDISEYYSDFTIYSMLNFYYYLLDVRYRFALDNDVLNPIYEVVNYFSKIVDQYVVKDDEFYKLLCGISALIAVLIPDKEPERISYLHVIDDSVVDNFVSGAKFYHLGVLAGKIDVDAAFQALEKALSMFDDENFLTEETRIRHLMDVIYGESLIVCAARYVHVIICVIWRC